MVESSQKPDELSPKTLNCNISKSRSVFQSDLVLSLFHHNEGVFGQKKNPRYLRQNISLDDEAERTFGGRAILSVTGQDFFGADNTFLGAGQYFWSSVKPERAAPSHSS